MPTADPRAGRAGPDPDSDPHMPSVRPEAGRSRQPWQGADARITRDARSLPISVRSHPGYAGHPDVPNSEHYLPGYLCTGLYAVNTSGIMPTQVLSFVSESPPSLAQADDHRAKAVLRAVRHLKC